ncbi:hypothetical protein, partial [Pseudomonas syringae]|uniref:hypothetical protein n=1 Tax=Pseudomonas syringae TaxID=317 RepID=UPI0034D4186C
LRIHGGMRRKNRNREIFIFLHFPKPINSKKMKKFQNPSPFLTQTREHHRRRRKKKFFAVSCPIAAPFVATHRHRGIDAISHF